MLGMSPFSTRSGKTSMKPSSIGGPCARSKPAERDEEDQRHDPEGEQLACPDAVGVASGPASVPAPRSRHRSRRRGVPLVGRAPAHARRVAPASGGNVRRLVTNGRGAAAGSHRPATTVVTGAAGWLGQNLVRALAAQPERARDPLPRPRSRCRARCSRWSARRSRPSSATCAIRPRSIDCFDGIGDASVFHAAAVIHPQRSTRELFDVNVGGTQLVLDRARRVRRDAVRARLVELAVRREPRTSRTASTRTRQFAPYMAYGRSKLEAEAARAAQLRPRRPRHRHRPPAVVLRPVPTRAPDAVLRRDPARSVPAASAPARSADRWCTRATSCRALLLAESRRAAPGQRVLDRRRRALRAARHAADGARRARGRRSAVRQPAPRPRSRGSPACTAEKLDGAAAGHGPLRAGAARARRAEGHDRVRHLPGAQGARLRAGGRAVRRNAGERALVPRREARRSDGSLGARHGRQRLLRHGARRARGRAGRHGARSST